MAKLSGPLMSLNASGQIGKTITFAGWKGIKTARQYSVPANPQTADQLSQRSLLTAAVEFYRTHLQGADEQAAWNLAALHDPRPLSGFNAFSSNALKRSAVDPDAAFVTSQTMHMSLNYLFHVENVDGTIAETESGDFSINVGVTAGKLSTAATGPISTGDISMDFDAAGYSVDDVVYVQIVKDGAARSGIYKLTLA